VVRVRHSYLALVRRGTKTETRRTIYVYIERKNSLLPKLTTNVGGLTLFYAFILCIFFDITRGASVKSIANPQVIFLFPSYGDAII
jgi:hypothetical protein